MDRSAAQAWLDRYTAAWKTYDPDDIGALFSESATYRYHPYDPEDEVLRGRDAIVADWLSPDGNASTRDEPGTFDAEYTPWAVDGNRVVATGMSRYWTDASRTTLSRSYHNVFLLTFDDEGRCTDFSELYMKEPEPA
jgi:ketosteroid isomerase-like protein